MPYTVEWLVENRIIFIKSFGVVTSQDVIETSREAAELAERGAGSSPVLVHAISNMLDVAKQPSLAEQFALRGQLRLASNPGWLIFIVKANSVIRFITAVAIQFFNLRFRLVESMPEALKLLQELDPTLPDLSGLISQNQGVEAQQGK